MKYFVDDIRTMTGEAKEIEAKSPLEAVKKAYPQKTVTRDFSNSGDIVVGRYTKQYYGRGYRTYVYNIG